MVQMQHRAGLYLLEKALGKEAFEKAEIAIGEHGKPYIVNTRFSYNISHSGRYAVLVTAKTEVGVDIQECKPVRKETIAKRFFARKEWEAVASEDRQGLEDTDDIFYQIWCRKEAYGKFLGMGLTEDVLQTNVLRGLEEQTPVQDKEELPLETAPMADCRFHDLSLPDGYQISICSRKGESLEKIIRFFEGL